ACGEEVWERWRGCEYCLYQAFPVSHFERDKPKVRPEFAALHGRESSASFEVDEGDRYRVKLNVVGRSHGPKADVLVDGRPIGTLDTDNIPGTRSGDATRPTAEGSTPAADARTPTLAPALDAAPLATPELRSVGLAKGART